MKILDRCSALYMFVTMTVAGFAAQSPGDDWPQWRGPERDGVWRETGLIDKFEAPQIELVTVHGLRP